MVRDRLRLRTSGIVVHGVIDEMCETTRARGRRQYMARVRFTPLDGQEIVQDAIGRYGAPFEAGHPVVVRYLPDQPSTVSIGEKVPLAGYLLVTSVFLAVTVFLIVALVTGNG